MSTTFPSDDLRIPPMPRTNRTKAGPPLPIMSAQLAVSAGLGFFLAWVLARFVIG
ncbi:hypothetical protein [Roseococcus sp.]|uniref:hypothetical protein n=1 Tax=Roseococcus sp. TaxID=2109646 RepID=UPI003BA94801